LKQDVALEDRIPIIKFIFLRKNLGECGHHESHILPLPEKKRENRKRGYYVTQQKKLAKVKSALPPVTVATLDLTLAIKHSGADHTTYATTTYEYNRQTLRPQTITKSLI